MEQNEKKWAQSGQTRRLLGQYQMHQQLHYQGPREEAENGPEKIFQDITAKKLIWGKKTNMRKETLTH